MGGRLVAVERRTSDPKLGKQYGHGRGSGSTPAPAVAEISVGATSGTTCSALGSFASDSVANSHLTLASAPARFFEPRCFLAKTRFETPSGGFLIVGVAISSSVFAFFLDGSLQVAPMAVCFSIVFVDVPLRTKNV